MKNLIIVGITLFLLVFGIFAITAFEKDSVLELENSSCNGNCTSGNYCSSSSCTAKTTGECNCGSSCNQECNSEKACGSSQCAIAKTSKCGCKN